VAKSRVSVTVPGYVGFSNRAPKEGKVDVVGPPL